MNTITKPEAAKRQLDVAIQILFEDKDPLAIRTLAGAAHEILADLVEKKRPGESWRSHLIESTGLEKGQAVKVLHSVQNFLKHADRDPEGTLVLEEAENDHAIFFATLECSELGERLSKYMQVFQIWYIASYHQLFEKHTDILGKAKIAFPDLDRCSREQSLYAGRQFLRGVEEKWLQELGS